MSMKAEVGLRPWAFFTGRRHLRSLDRAAPDIRLGDYDRPYLFCPPAEVDASARRLRDGLQLHAEFRDHKGRRYCILALPVPRSPKAGVELGQGENPARVIWPEAPDRPPATLDPKTDEECRSAEAMAHVQRVVARIHDVKAALDDPINLWQRVAELWESAQDDADPDRDIILRHARLMPRIIEELFRAPRKVLTRTRFMLPLNRIQEMDRTSMLWLVRQPGTTMAERGGAEQRILSPARVETADTLENRVLRSMAELGRNVAREYCHRNSHAGNTLRFNRVDKYRRLCTRVAHGLQEFGVRKAPPDAMPNYVLQNDYGYARVWEAYQELLQRYREREELWKWQARSWEEFCAIATVVALSRLSGAKMITAAPIIFREDQDRGLWLSHDNPLAVFHLTEHDLMIEVQVRDDKGDDLAWLAAPIWLRIGDFSDGFLWRVAIWPVHDFVEGADKADAAEICRVIEQIDRKHQLRGGIVLRPARIKVEAFCHDSSRARALSASLAPSGDALRQSLENLSKFCAGFLSRRAR